MRYVVTGAAGFIGSHLAETLLAAGHDVLGVDSYTDYYERARKERNAAGLDVLESDLADAALAPILAGVDGVFHLAGQPGVRASWGESFQLYLRRNVLATQRLFEAAADAGVRVVFASSSSVYGDAERYPTAEDVTPQPISPYGITKLACEHLAVAVGRARGLESVTLPVLHRLRPTPATRHGVQPRCSRLSPAARRSGSSATAAPRGASRTSATPSQPRSLRWNAVARGGSTTSAVVTRRR
jgi:UDP-glucose 4-epimerase